MLTRLLLLTLIASYHYVTALPSLPSLPLNQGHVDHHHQGHVDTKHTPLSLSLTEQEQRLLLTPFTTREEYQHTWDLLINSPPDEAWGVIQLLHSNDWTHDAHCGFWQRQRYHQRLRVLTWYTRLRRWLSRVRKMVSGRFTSWSKKVDIDTTNGKEDVNTKEQDVMKKFPIPSKNHNHNHHNYQYQVVEASSTGQHQVIEASSTGSNDEYLLAEDTHKTHNTHSTMETLKRKLTNILSRWSSRKNKKDITPGKSEMSGMKTMDRNILGSSNVITEEESLDDEFYDAHEHWLDHDDGVELDHQHPQIPIPTTPTSSPSPNHATRAFDFGSETDDHHYPIKGHEIILYNPFSNHKDRELFEHDLKLFREDALREDSETPTRSPKQRRSILGYHRLNAWQRIRDYFRRSPPSEVESNSERDEDDIRDGNSASMDQEDRMNGNGNGSEDEVSSAPVPGASKTRRRRVINIHGDGDSDGEEEQTSRSGNVGSEEVKQSNEQTDTTSPKRQRTPTPSKMPVKTRILPSKRPSVESFANLPKRSRKTLPPSPQMMHLSKTETKPKSKPKTTLYRDTLPPTWIFSPNSKHTLALASNLDDDVLHTHNDPDTPTYKDTHPIPNFGSEPDLNVYAALNGVDKGDF